MKKKNVTGYILMVLATIIFGLEIVLQKKILNDSIRPESITIYRAIFTFIAMTVMNMFNKKDTSKEVLKDKGEAKKYIKNVILMALFFAFNCYTFATGLKLSSATITTFINSVLTTITTVVLLAIFIPKERKNFKSVYTITATIITFIGIMFTNEVFTNKFDASQDFNVGLLFIFISAIL
ncbi:MAG: DMT family transporter [Clostridia bacterium]|nr:DMT family transporter [Clostridia bacterium]